MSRLTTWRGQRNPQLKKAQVFHHLVAKILYICRHTRQDIHTAGEFLYRSKKTRHGQLQEAFMHNATKDLTLTIKSENYPQRRKHKYSTILSRSYCIYVDILDKISRQRGHSCVQG